MVVEKEGFGAFKNNNINMLLFSYCLIITINYYYIT